MVIKSIQVNNGHGLASQAERQRSPHNKKIQNNNNKVGLHVTYIRVGHCAQTTIADGGDDTDWFHFINRYCYRVFISDSDVLDDDDHRRRRRWTVLENSL